MGGSPGNSGQSTCGVRYNIIKTNHNRDGNYRPGYNEHVSAAFLSYIPCMSKLTAQEL
jgi:hypothetical protein